jgi:hypothetical protein
MNGCYGNDLYDRWLEARQNEYWESVLVDDEDGQPTATERREEAAEAEADRRRDER